MLGVDARGDVLRGRAAGALAQLGRLLRHGDGVQVDDAEDRVVGGLHVAPLQQGTGVVAEVQAGGGGLHAREQAGEAHSSILSG